MKLTKTAELNTGVQQLGTGRKTFGASLFGGGVAGGLGWSPLPVEWVGSGEDRPGCGSWTLPSGKALAEFAFEAGFLAPLLMRSPGFPVFKATVPLIGGRDRKRQ